MTLDPQILNPAFIDTSLDSRAVTFENPTGARGAGGTAHGGRKGAPNRTIQPGETVVLADLEGPGVIRHIWVTIPVMRPERMRAQTIEVRYDGRDEPSIAAPLLDFFGLSHGRTAPFSSAVLTAQEGRGFNCYLPIPFRQRLEMRYTNHSDREVTLYYQLDYTLQPELPRRDRLPPRGLPPREPHHPEAGLRDHRGPARPRSLPRLQHRGAGDRPRQLVRRGRGEDLPGR